jgi:transcription elongation factor Elf1
MTCAKCGAEMNHQADKLVHPVTREEVAGMTPTLDGVIESVFACPECGWVDSLRAAGGLTPGQVPGADPPRTRS